MDVEITPKYSFVPITEKKYQGLSDKKTQDLLQKWH